MNVITSGAELLDAVKRYSAATKSATQLRTHIREVLQRVCDRNTQKVVAESFGVSPQHINDVINARRELSDRVIEKITYASVRGLK